MLYKKSREIDSITPRIIELIDDMVDTMSEQKGIGLAAVQVGVLRRAVVVDIGEGPIKMLNPVITETAGEETTTEACLSIPGFRGMVKRPVSVKVKFTGIDGQDMELEATGLLKKAICHELDHLDGVLYPMIAETFEEVAAEDLEEDDDIEDGDIEEDDSGNMPEDTDT